MKALGMIEVYGYLTAVEALDSALKAANVSLTDVVRVSGGLVTVLVNGEIGAVKAAIDASAAAAQRVGTVVSVHVIPRPTADVARMLSEGSQGKSSPSEPDLIKESGAIKEPNLRREPAFDTELALIKDPISFKEPEKEERELDKTKVGHSKGQLEQMVVVELRKLARGIDQIGMSREEIRFARKQELIHAILESLGQER